MSGSVTLPELFKRNETEKRKKGNPVFKNYSLPEKRIFILATLGLTKREQNLQK